MQWILSFWYTEPLATNKTQESSEIYVNDITEENKNTLKEQKLLEEQKKTFVLSSSELLNAKSKLKKTKKQIQTNLPAPEFVTCLKNLRQIPFIGEKTVLNKQTPNPIFIELLEKCELWNKRKLKDMKLGIA